jgi:multiple sugar transport system substrate-binding protein
MIPARNSAREEAAYKDSVQAALAEQTENLRFLPPVAGLGEVTPETIEVAVAEGVLGNAAPEEALSSAQTKAQQLLEEVQQRYGSGS